MKHWTDWVRETLTKSQGDEILLTPEDVALQVAESGLSDYDSALFFAEQYQEELQKVGIELSQEIIPPTNCHCFN